MALTFSASSSIWRSSRIGSLVGLFFRQFDDTGRSTVDRALMMMTTLVVMMMMITLVVMMMKKMMKMVMMVMMMMMIQWSVEEDRDNI